MINKSLPQLCLMLPVCPILVFQLNWKHLSIMGTYDGTDVKLAGRGTIPCQWIWGTLRISQPLWLCTSRSLGRERNEGEHLQGGGGGAFKVMHV